MNALPNKRRSSALSGTSPVTASPITAPAAVTPEPTPLAAVPPVAAQEQVRPAPITPSSAPDQAPPPAPETVAPRTKVTFYIDAALADRMRATVVATTAFAEHATVSEFIENAVLKAVEDLEAEHNDGKPYPIALRAKTRRGRPIGS